MNILEGKLLGSTILIIKPKAEDKTAGGVILPASIVDEKNNTASSRIGYRVISIGHQIVNIKPNDIVLPHRNTQYNHHTYNGNDYMIIDESEVVMVFQNKDEELISPQTAIKLLK